MSIEPVVIIGGGVSGLHAASLLTARGVSCILLESRSRLGGRALSEKYQSGNHDAAQYFDLGPAWFWPDGQPAITQLAQKLGVAVFPQFAAGAMRVERFRLEAPQSFVPDDSMVPDALRFRDGLQSLVTAMADTIPTEAIQLDARVTAVSRRDGGGATVTLANGTRIDAHTVITALPLRIIASRITFDPPLPEELQQAMQATPTWMAPHAKMLAVYDTPFWRAAGFSGMVSSMVGPLQEIHDASPPTGAGALFGFVGIGAGARAAIGEAGLRERVIAQLVRLFGEQAQSPTAVYFKDWATDEDTTTGADLEPSALPHGPGSPLFAEAHWDGALLLAGAESADEHPGYLEGAVRAAERAVAMITPR